jgi:hypothetical protein
MAILFFNGRSARLGLLTPPARARDIRTRDVTRRDEYQSRRRWRSDFATPPVRCFAAAAAAAFSVHQHRPCGGWSRSRRGHPLLVPA